MGFWAGFSCKTVYFSSKFDRHTIQKRFDLIYLALTKTELEHLNLAWTKIQIGPGSSFFFVGPGLVKIDKFEKFHWVFHTENKHFFC